MIFIPCWNGIRNISIPVINAEFVGRCLVSCVRVSWILGNIILKKEKRSSSILDVNPECIMKTGRQHAEDIALNRASKNGQ